MEKLFLLLVVLFAASESGCGHDSYDGEYLAPSYDPCRYWRCDSQGSPVLVPDGGLRVFVTRMEFTGDLAGAAGTASGISGADALCASAARSAHLGGRWNAWLSDSTTQAEARTQIAASGYYNVRGGLLFRRLQDVKGGRLDRYVTTDEWGSTLGVFTWTGTGVGASTCGDWTQSSPESEGTALGAVYSLPCDTPAHLICFERSPDGPTASADGGAPDASPTSPDGGSAEPAPAPVPTTEDPALPDAGTACPKKRAFVSSTTMTGTSLHDTLASAGKPGVDALCNGLAASAGLPGTYHARISASESASGALSSAAAPLAEPIVSNEAGQGIPEHEEVWVGAEARAFCTEFISATGEPVFLGTTTDGLRACSEALRIHCIED